MVELNERDKARLSKLPKRLRPFIGPQGLAGKEGRQGKQGLDGKAGSKGDKGDKGDRGNLGDQGESGLDGDTGAQGDTGEKGDTGKPGHDGSPGSTGSKGDKGDLGGKGDKGDGGDSGKSGADGLDGFDGRPGRDGEQGLKGEEGPQGKKGDEGLPGERAKELSKRDRERIIDEIARTLPSFGVAISPGAMFGAGVIQTTNLSSSALLGGGVQTVFCDASGGSFTVTLPTASGAKGRVYYIKKTDNSANTITVAGNGATIDGFTTKIIATQYDSMMTISDGTNWHII